MLHSNHPQKMPGPTAKYKRKYTLKDRRRFRRWARGHPERNRTVSHKVSRLIRKCLKRAKAPAKAFRRSEDLLGYSMKDLEHHLKQRIPKGYTWRDYTNGTLELDHIVPISHFNISCAEDLAFRECWSLHNLRLLPASQNRQKSGTLPGRIRPFSPPPNQPNR